MDIAIVIGVLLFSLILFSIGKFSVDWITLCMLAVLMLTGILTPAEALSGFGEDYVWMLAALFVLSGALQETGILDLLGSTLLKQAKGRTSGTIARMMTAVGFTSSFMNNTAVTAIYLAPVLSVARRTGISGSKLLIPMAYASILGGTCTLIGTSTNLAVSGYLQKHGYQTIGIFDITPVGLSLFLIGVVFLSLFSGKLLPDHPNETIAEEFGLREYVSEVIISAGSPMIGQPVFSSRLATMGFRILNIIRNKTQLVPDHTSVLSEGDVLLVEGNISTLMDVKEVAGVEIRADAFIERDLQGDNFRLAELLVTPQSLLVNRTLRDTRFRHDYGLVVIAINRRSQSVYEKIGHLTLQVGDVLLVQGAAEKISYYRRTRELHILEDFKPLLYRKKKGYLSVLAFLAAIICSITGLLPSAPAFLVAALLVIAAKAVSLSRAYEMIDFRLLILIAGMSAMGVAMLNTGAAAWISNGIIEHLQPFGLHAIMAGFIILTVLLTQPMSNAAAALVVLPIALESARTLGVSPQPFAIAVMLSASVSLVAPFEPSCMLVYAPGRYRFSDFFRAGFILTILLMIALVVLVPLYWKF